MARFLPAPRTFASPRAGVGRAGDGCARVTGVDVPDRPAMAPGTNFRERQSGAGGADDETFGPVLAEVSGALERARVPHVFMGGVGAATYGRPRWTHDIDVFVRPEDAGLALRSLD